MCVQSQLHVRALVSPTQVGHGWSVDVAAHHARSGARIALEVDGPWHFARNQPTLALGHTRVRDACLERLGWRVVSLNLTEPGGSYSGGGGGAVVTSTRSQAAQERQLQELIEAAAAR